MPDYLTEWAHQKIDERLNSLVIPMQEHLDKIQTEYHKFWDDHFINDFKIFCQSHTFEECTQKYEELQLYQEKLLQFLPYEYFEIGILEQIDLIRSLQRRVTTCIENLLNSLVVANFEANEKIHNEFRSIGAKAAKIPESTEELVELGAFMQNAKLERINELNLMIQDSMMQSIELLGKRFEILLESVYPL